MENIATKIGKRAREFRLKKHLSQGDVAKILGVHPTYISSIERGVRNMSIKNIERFAKALGVPIEDLIR
jgi:transcriptional regulator with XRE-family HTH domain